MVQRAALLILLIVLAGCGGMKPAPVGDSRAPTPVEAARPGAFVPAPAAAPVPVAADGSFYVVKKGDTLHAIALDHGVDYRELAAWNNLENINRITVGQRLRVSAPGTVPAVAATSGVAEARPIASGGGVVARPLDGTSAGAAVQNNAAGTAGAVPPAPTFTPGGEPLKRSPKGGKLPYSVENLARLKAQGVAPAPLVAAPAVSAPAAQPETPAVPPPVVISPAAASAGDIDWAWPAAGKLLASFSEGGAGQEANKGIDIAGKLGDPVLAAAPGKVVYAGSGLRGYGNLVIVRHNAMFLSAYAHNSRILVKEGQTVTRGQRIAELGNSDADQPKLHFEVRQQGKPVDPLKFLPPR
ncbi:MAG: peptidoglycan DD-metalloendopeptidase family protein [Rhodocyclaceae bacterium]|nr:peptidoglycan DD-metalloendopeptidase family protein [Rhodocyclaceae bacterium]